MKFSTYEPDEVFWCLLILDDEECKRLIINLDYKLAKQVSYLTKFLLETPVDPVPSGETVAKIS